MRITMGTFFPACGGRLEMHARSINTVRVGRHLQPLPCARRPWLCVSIDAAIMLSVSALATRAENIEQQAGWSEFFCHTVRSRCSGTATRRAWLQETPSKTRPRPARKSYIVTLLRQSCAQVLGIGGEEDR